MTPYWAELVETGRVNVLSAEANALAQMQTATGLPCNGLPAGYWSSLKHPVDALDFSDFVVLVRDDMQEAVAHLLTWCLVETRAAIEQQYHHLAPNRSPLSYPLVPQQMARTPVPLHSGAERYYRESGLL